MDWVELSIPPLLSRPRLRLIDATNDQLLGSYSFRKLYVYCWSEDSSGIHVADWIQELRVLFSPKVGPRQ